MMPTEKTRLQVTLSSFLDRRLTLYAKVYDKPRTTMLTQLLEEILEQKTEIIDKLIEETAKAEGVLPEDLVKKWLSEGS